MTHTEFEKRLAFIPVYDRCPIYQSIAPRIAGLFQKIR